MSDTKSDVSFTFDLSFHKKKSMKQLCLILLTRVTTKNSRNLLSLMRTSAVYIIRLFTVSCTLDTSMIYMLEKTPLQN